ncbi:MAG: hypothetical protein DI598_14245 [Pseudopedobacter saltans]|uniref:O-antigen polymerase n=1 Tax=Pseudopedobacter saltans TaxID=151895 RepID=A0A2W5ESU7_9SPHI|nr:MAG: hypothetical protein DI598_14245 [Pseudopedobacter saltans]
MKLGKKNIDNFDCIAIGLILHTIGEIFFISSKPICYTFCALGIIFPLIGFLMSSKDREIVGVPRIILFSYTCWNIITVLRPILAGDFDKQSFSPITPYMVLSFFVPLFATLKYNRQVVFKKILNYNMFCGIIGFLLAMVFSKELLLSNMVDMSYEEYQEYVDLVNIPATFLLISSTSILFNSFLSKKLKFIAWSSFVLGFIVMSIGARRSGLVNYLILIVFQIIVYFKRKDIKFKSLKLVAILGILFLATFYIANNLETLFPLLRSRVDEDSRSGVEDYFYASFNGKTSDWIFGRGLTGTYFCPFFADVNRNIIETGYLNIILKGGLLSLFFYLYLLGYAFFNGLFRSKNVFIKGLSLYILLHIIILIPFGIPFYSYEFFILWVAVVCCFSKSLRILSDKEVNNILVIRKIR